MKKKVCSSARTLVTGTYELIEISGWAIPKFDSITKIGICLDLQGQFPTMCAGPLQKVQIWLMGVESIIEVGIIEIV